MFPKYLEIVHTLGFQRQVPHIMDCKKEDAKCGHLSMKIPRPPKTLVSPPEDDLSEGGVS